MVEAALPFPSIDPEIIRVGPVAIRWYALAYIAGLLLGWHYIVRLLGNHSLWAGKPFGGKPPASPEHVGDLFVWITLGVIIGGRLGFVIFYGILYCGFAGEGQANCGGLPWGFVENWGWAVRSGASDSIFAAQYFMARYPSITASDYCGMGRWNVGPRRADRGRDRSDSFLPAP